MQTNLNHKHQQGITNYSLSNITENKKHLSDSDAINNQYHKAHDIEHKKDKAEKKHRRRHGYQGY